MKIPSRRGSVRYSESGLTLVETMIAIGIGSISVMAFASLLDVGSQLLRRTRLAGEGLDLRSNMTAILLDPAALKQTMDDPDNAPAFACLTDTVNPCGTATPVQLLDRWGAIVPNVFDPTDPASATKGLTLDGRPCTGYDDVNGNPQCPFHVRVSWEADCGGAVCGSSPQIAWILDIRFKPGNNSGFTAINRSIANVYRFMANLPQKSATGLDSGLEVTCVLLNSGMVKCWGGGWDGSHGSVIGAAEPTPTTVRDSAGQPLNGISKLDVSNDTACALHQSGRLYCWGENFFGQLGRGVTAHPHIPWFGTPPYVNTSTLIYSDHRADFVVNPTNTGPLENVTEIYGGENDFCALSNGDILCWGYTEYGQSAVPNPNPKNGIYAYRDDGSGGLILDVFCWGRNQFGGTGDATTVGSYTPFPVKVNLPGRVQTVSAGKAHTCALLTGGDVYCWGDNKYGQLGQGSTSLNLSATPLKVTGL